MMMVIPYYSRSGSDKGRTCPYSTSEWGFNRIGEEEEIQDDYSLVNNCYYKWVITFIGFISLN